MFGETFRDRQPPMVLVLGLGESGLAMARWCARHGCRLRVADTRVAPPNLPMLEAERIDAEFVGGPFSPALVERGVELVVVSPGLSPLSPELAPLVDAAREQGIPVWGELELFARALRHLGESGYAPKLIAITGTNGKTTTTSLTGLLCRRAGKSVAVAGNIGPTMLDTLAEAIDRTELPDVWVLELSSFQLETAHTFAPDAAAVLNVTQDHLDWHGTFEAYAAAKGRIFGPHTVRVLNRDDAQTMAFAPGGESDVRVVTFGLNEPQRAGDFGLQRENGINWLVEAAQREPADETASSRRRKQEAAAAVELTMKRLMPADALRIRGLHNAANALAAFALARAVGLAAAPLLHGLREYRGEPHRVELIASIDGVDYVDDSKGTNVGATVAALDGLAQRAVVILGGDGKGQDFSPLARPVARWCRAVMLIGRDAPAIRAALAETGVALADHATLEAAVHAAAELAEPGEAVLLSPACASFDMFKNYAHRADVFRSAVEEIAAQRGTML
ncbi:UDP-N-acetylmuramoyl-L-alanine--D-glutamate ligase [Trinickia caryophylli]|uniref:UDP-N-acetylmuramoylalanine--D-glutamate ligase n=1 Tax=Trinickia caryophylli TaxID=28094 RepID=A0A1X7C8B5_TRICW|nr:UDP-N-acetylmuramoyl-L-alanine--D-glutamate ligase [Trinickia caryophylli]PMS09305.1 UDP-N-acetylmuramoyl-L-alanine--D-glutamate ligase [Trinickia caryophylli]TRX19565.1 UDP-N-acetylmuramoyl-L-alanine--D-glutamate ligase [Trinickia caryophylli]WQE13124.1 UDP-N-acetylmuramoyl-L-alanine--D-glutamate ligase [Trinickia caryophylli]SME91930.1 UDP-N-acetylmuramoylalanine--D-glutamate ligase [Trinickia caryophylli]GLU30865.1 UDP-N-acetylmuramoylalanine--D-glutamate ligase [Trinickia caryophylli]